MAAARLAILAAASAVLAGCGAAHRAAEPAVAPAARLAPAGLSVHVGLAPEGIVSVPLAHLVVVVVRDPARLVVLDARSGRVVRRVPVSAPARHLELASPGGPVLVPAERAGRLLELRMPTGLVRSIAVGAHPHDAAAAVGRIFVGNEFGRSVSVIDRSRDVARIGGFLQPGGLAAAGRYVAVVDVGTDTITLIDAGSLAVIGRAPAGEGPTHVVSDTGGRLFVADTRGNALISYATRPALRQVARTPLPGTPYGVAVDRVRQRLWVTLTSTNQLAEVAVTARGLRPLATYPTARQPNSVAVDPSNGEVFVADAGAGVVQLITPLR